MKTITSQATAYLVPYSSVRVEDIGSLEDASKLAFISNDYHPEGWIKVGKATITVEIPETNEIVEAKVASLKEQLQQVRAESQLKINEIEDQIAKLSALTYEVQA